MAAIGAYEGDILFSSGTLRRHFENSDELNISGEAGLTLMGLDQEILEAHLKESSEI